NIRQSAAPSVAAIVSMQSVADSKIRGALHSDIQRRVNAQSAFVHRFCPVSRFEIFPELLEKVRRQVIAWILNMQPKRSFLSRSFFTRRNSSFFLHSAQDKIPAPQRALRIVQRQIDWPAHDSRKHRGR